ncbi:muropeptide transporter [Pannonibacter phragmitetus]|uniref:Muropeptide transporter n=1 Tax=Pannonibacter phragmitetus TaxID=121719 RepID=A0A379HJQ5_9HYPH|nr:MFS transporter [Pannonibacter phragmitetus]SUC82779.1 muropeptide transporter [Pannonibacter phragmitetus]
MQAASSLSLPRVLVAAGGIYTAQSTIGGLTFLGLPAALRASGMAMEHIGLLSLIMLIWAFKFLWAVPVERWRIRADGGRRTGVTVLAGQLVAAAAVAGLGLFAGYGLPVMLVLLAIMAFASATIDTACDGFLIERVPEGRRGLGNMVQVGGGYFGMVLGGSLFVWIYARYGWTAAAGVMAGLVLLMSVPLVLLREPFIPARQRVKGGLLAALRRRDMQAGLAMIVAFEAGGRFVQVLAGPYLVDAGLPLELVGTLTGAGSVAAGLAGTTGGGLAVQMLGAPRAMQLVALGQILVIGLLAFAAAMSPVSLTLLSALFVLQMAVMAAGFVVSYSRLMALASPDQPGADFSLVQSASALTGAVAGFSGGMLAGQFGFPVVFALAAALALPVPFILARLEGVISGKSSS